MIKFFKRITRFIFEHPADHRTGLALVREEDEDLGPISTETPIVVIDKHRRQSAFHQSRACTYPPDDVGTKDGVCGRC